MDDYMLNPIERRYWDEYLQSLNIGEQPVDPFVTAGFAGTPEITDELLALYLGGQKTAGSSLVEGFITAGNPLPKIGNFWIYLDRKSLPSCILQTEKIEINRFLDVPLSIAAAEGEGDLSLDYWRSVHSEVYAPYLKSWGLNRIEEATVITEFFKIVHR